MWTVVGAARTVSLRQGIDSPFLRYITQLEPVVSKSFQSGNHPNELPSFSFATPESIFDYKPKMHSFAKSILGASLAFVAMAKNIDIQVGESGIKFTPQTVTASPGDRLVFHFYPQNHSVAMGDFAKACAPTTSGGFFSGYLPVQSGVNVGGLMLLLLCLAYASDCIFTR